MIVNNNINLTPFQISETIKRHSERITMIQNAIKEQSSSIQQAMESTNKATLDLLQSHSDRVENHLESFGHDIHSRLTTLEITLEALIKLILVSDSTNISQEQINELKIPIMEFISPKRDVNEALQ